MEEFFTTNVFILLLLPSAFVIGLALVSVADKDITRAGVMFWGLVLIALAGYIASQLISWDVIGTALTEHKEEKKKLSKKAFDDFKRTSSLLLWLIPFVTGSLGTNFISDAIMNHERYQKPSGESIVAQILLCAAKKLFWAALWLTMRSIEILWPVVRFWTWPRRWRTSVRWNRRNYVRQHATAKQPWEK